jgi:hypothetical protein
VSGAGTPEGTHRAAGERPPGILRALLPITLVAGVGLMIPFEAAATRALGVALLFSFAAIGIFLIAEPGFLERDSSPATPPDTDQDR